MSFIESLAIQGTITTENDRSLRSVRPRLQIDQQRKTALQMFCEHFIEQTTCSAVISFCLRPAGSDPEVVCQKKFFLKVSVSLVGFGPSVAHGKHSVRRCCVQATKNKAETCSFLDAIGRRSLGIKIDVWENPVVYASTRDWSSLYGAIRSEPETAAQSSCSHCLWEHSRCLSSACIVVGVVVVTPAENFVSPLPESSPSPRKH